MDSAKQHPYDADWSIEKIAAERLLGHTQHWQRIFFEDGPLAGVQTTLPSEINTLITPEGWIYKYFDIRIVAIDPPTFDGPSVQLERFFKYRGSVHDK